jgi:hypothetical protein
MQEATSDMYEGTFSSEAAKSSVIHVSDEDMVSKYRIQPKFRHNAQRETSPLSRTKTPPCLSAGKTMKRMTGYRQLIRYRLLYLALLSSSSSETEANWNGTAIAPKG